MVELKKTIGQPKEAYTTSLPAVLADLRPCFAGYSEAQEPTPQAAIRQTGTSALVRFVAPGVRVPVSEAKALLAVRSLLPYLNALCDAGWPGFSERDRQTCTNALADLRGAVWCRVHESEFCGPDCGVYMGTDSRDWAFCLRCAEEGREGWR